MSEIIVVDNHDSFTFNLVESFNRFGHHVKTVRNTASGVRSSWLALATNRF